MLAEARIGPVPVPDGVISPMRSSRTGEIAVSNSHGFYQEAVSRGGVFSLTQITSTAISAGNLVGAGAAASTQFAVFNPTSSNKNIVLLRYRMGIISGTTFGAGATFHGLILNVPTAVAVGTGPVNLQIGGASSVAQTYAHVTGTALTGGLAPVSAFVSTISMTASTPGTVTPLVCEDWLDGSIVLRPGTGWVPLFAAAGTAIALTHGLMWEEVAI